MSKVEFPRGSWILELDGETDVAMRFAFRDGLVFGDGLPVGRYEWTDARSMRAMIGDDVTLQIAVAEGDRLAASMLTKRRREGPDLLEGVQVARITD